MVLKNKFCRTSLHCFQGSDVFYVKSGDREESNKQGEISLVIGTRFQGSDVVKSGAREESNKQGKISLVICTRLRKRSTQ